MQRFSISLMGALLGISLVTAAIEQSDAKVADAKVAKRPSPAASVAAI